MKIQTTKVYTEIQSAFDEGHTTVSAQGSSRSAKTYNILLWLITRCLTHPGTTVSVCRATLPALKASAMRDFIEILHRMHQYDTRAFNKTDLLYTFPNGSWVEFFSCDNEAKLRGRKRKILFANEATELRHIEWQQLKLRTTRLAIIDYNPTYTDDHWINEVNQDTRTHHFITTYKDNPFLEQTIIDELESLRHKNPALWQIYGLGQRAIVEGLVFTRTHTIPTMPPPHTLIKPRTYAGIDFGYTHDPTAIVRITIEEETKTIYIEEITYRTHMLTTDIIRELKALGQIKVISESADPRLVDEIHRAGIDIHPVRKYSGSIEAGIAKMQEYTITTPRSATNVIKELQNYTYATDRHGHHLNHPIDAYNHAIDATRYVIMTQLLGGRPTPIDLQKIATRIGR